MLTGSFICTITLIAMIFYHINGESVGCLDREKSPLCFCRSIQGRTLLRDLFISKISLSKCSASSSTRQCRQGRLYPSSTNVTQLVPNLVNYSHCLKDRHCLQTLRNTQRCQNCQIIPPSLLTENTSYTISTTTNNLPTDSCFYICEHDKSCGFLCFDRRITITISCKLCGGRRRNVTCRCIRVKQSQSCVQRTTETTIETTTARWMQKRGFPAAAILALLALIMILLVLAMKLIRHQLDTLARRQSIINRRSITTLTTSYRSGQPSPSTAISFSNTPLISRGHLRKDIVTANAMVELLNNKSQEYIVDIHRRTNPDKLSDYLLERTSKLNLKSKEIIHNNTEEDQS